MWERAFFSLGQPQKYSSSQIPTGKQFVLIDRVEGLDGKYLGRGHDVRTERIDRVPIIFPSGSKQTQSIRILLYNR